MSAGFTPGPWDFALGVNEYGRADGPILGSITKGGTWHLAVLPSDLGPESRANARLIAAAPDLLVACEAQEELVNFTGDDARLAIKRVQQMRRAAILKARGETL